jgi:hypothetical protein
MGLFISVLFAFRMPQQSSLHVLACTSMPCGSVGSGWVECSSTLLRRNNIFECGAAFGGGACCHFLKPHSGPAPPRAQTPGMLPVTQRRPQAPWDLASDQHDICQCTVCSLLQRSAACMHGSQLGMCSSSSHTPQFPVQHVCCFSARCRHAADLETHPGRTCAPS